MYTANTLRAQEIFKSLHLASAAFLGLQIRHNAFAAGTNPGPSWELTASPLGWSSWD